MDTPAEFRAAPGSRNDFDSRPEARSRLMRSSWVRSWIGQARPGDVTDPDPQRRSAAWANWAGSALVEVSNGKRTYPALRLPGDFYDPRGDGPRTHPHLEVPAKVFRSTDDEFPTRLAQAGCGLHFSFWLYSEVTAVRRALFNTEPGPIGEFTELLDERRGALRDGLSVLSRYAAPNWGEIASKIIADPDGLAPDACDDFSAEEVASWLPAAAEFGIEVRFDVKLLERNGAWASRRVGVWQIRGTTVGGDEFSFGVVTPRLTANSLFSDPLFAAEHEAPAAALVRSLVLRRIIDRHLGGGRLVRHRIGDPVPEVRTESDRPRSVGHLQAVVSQPGQKNAEASLSAAMGFLAAYPDPDAAWDALCRWADRGFILTVTPHGFRAAHRNASRARRRAEEPSREDIDLLLPLAWDNREGHAQVVRVTWNRGRDGS